MTNLTLVNNQHTTTLQTTPGNNNNLVKLPNSNGTILTREELDVILKDINTGSNGGTFTDPKLPGFEFSNNGSISKLPDSLPLIIKVGKSSQATFKTLSEAVKYLSKYNFGYYNKVYADLVHVHIEDGTDFGDPIILRNVDLSWVIFIGNIESRTYSIVNINPNMTNFCIYTHSSILRMVGIKFVANELKKTFCYCGYQSLIYLNSCSFDFRIDGSVFGSPLGSDPRNNIYDVHHLFVAIDKSYLAINGENTKIKLRYENVNNGSPYDPHPFWVYLDSSLTIGGYSGGFGVYDVEVSFNNCDNVGVVLFAPRENSYVNMQGISINITATNSRYMNNIIIAAPGFSSRCNMVSAKIADINFDCVTYHVCFAYYNSSACADRIGDLYISGTQSGQYKCYFRVASGSQISVNYTTRNDDIDKRDSNVTIGNTALNTVTGNGIIYSNGDFILH